MSQLNVVKNSVSADQIYFDVTVTNTKSTTTLPPIFYYNESRTIPFVNNPQDYYLSILRFTIDTGTLPVFIPTVSQDPLDATNPNHTIYSVTLSFTKSTGVVVDKQVFIEWVPQDRSAPVPQAPQTTASGTQDNSQGYYNCYSYSYFTSLVFKAFAQAFIDLQTACSADANWDTATYLYPPIINWDTTSGQGIIYANKASYNLYTVVGGIPTPNADAIRVYMNAPLFALYGSFPSIINGYVGVTDGKNFQIAIVDIGNTNYTYISPDPVPTPPTPATYTAITMFQEYSTVSNWTPIVALVFVSNTLPVTPNQVSTPLVYSDLHSFTLGGNNASTANIITDLVSDTGLYKSFLVYEPSAQYRYVTLNGNRPLFNIDLQVFWRDRLGGLNPVRIPSGGSVTMKIGFLKKGGSAV
jgi:hypothetical protein